MKKANPLKLVFINPNPPEAFQAVLKKILLEKLLTEFACPQGPPAEADAP